MEPQPNRPRPSLREQHQRALALALRPLVRFLRTEAAGGIVLLVCTALALALANSPWDGRYAELWHTHLTLLVGDWGIDQSLEWWVNDGLMTLFFFVVGLEIKRELVSGELRDPRKAALPAAAALGGMVVPAGIYLALQAGQAGSRGWGVPMATDIAFVVGVLALLGPRVPGGLKVMLLSLAIVDDLGAVLVIAVAYSSELALGWLGGAAGGVAFVLVLRWLRVRAMSVYALTGLAVWYATYRSGIHPTIAGVALGFLTRSRQRVGKRRLLAVLDQVAGQLRANPEDDDLNGLSDEVQAVVEHGRNTLSPLDRLLTALHPWVAFVIMPLFALANAGVTVRLDLLFSPVALAVAAGLLLGKPLGIILFSLAAVAARIARLPAGVDGRLLIGAGCLGGIGFTMSLFIAALGFEGQADLLAAAKVGTLSGSVLSALLGAGLLRWALAGRSAPQPDE